MVEALGEIPVRVRLAPPFGIYRDTTRSEYMELHEFLIEYIGGLFSEMGIPFRLALALEVAEDNDLQSTSTFRPYDIHVNGTLCRYPPNLFPSEHSSPFEIAASIAHIVYANRTLLVDLEVSHKIFAYWCQKDEAGIISNWIAHDFNDLLSKTMQYGISFFWLESAIVSGCLEGGETGKPIMPDSVFETVVFSTDVITVGVLLPEDLYKRLITEKPEQDQVKSSMAFILTLIQEGFFLESGVHIPPIKLSVDTSLDVGWVRVQINNLRFPPTRSITQNQMCVNSSGDRFSLLCIPFSPTRNPTGQECSIFSNTAEFEAVCKEDDLETYDEEGWLAVLLSDLLRKNLPLLLPREMVEFELWQLNQNLSHLVETFLKFFTINQLTSILRELLAEKVSIRNLRYILELLLELLMLLPDSGHLQIPIATWVELLRTALRVQITSQLASKGRKLIIWILDPKWESKFELAGITNKNLDFLVETIRVQLGSRPSYPLPVLLSSRKIRPKVWRAIRRDFPFISVISYGEIWEIIDVFPVGRIPCPEK